MLSKHTHTHIHTHTHTFSKFGQLRHISNYSTTDCRRTPGTRL